MQPNRATAVIVYRIATQQQSTGRWKAFSPDDTTDCAFANTEFQAMRRLIARWESEQQMEDQQHG